ncbi:class I SAM-dependent DNA methyltransferase [Amorphus sp. MBR-141]
MSERADVFETLYRSNLDPWDYETSFYEQDKYRMTLAALPRERYRSAVEIGCSIAVLGEKLAGRATRYLGLDVSPTAVETASDRLAGLPWATAVVGEVPEEWPVGRYDLVVLSEILYFLSAEEIAELAAFVARDTVAGGDCVVVNWHGQTDTQLTGAEAGATFLSELARHRQVRPKHDYQHPCYRLSVVRLD